MSCCTHPLNPPPLFSGGNTLLEQLHAFEEVDAEKTSQDQAGDLSKYPTHPVDLGTDANTEEVELAIGTRMSQELAEIDAALDRLATSPETLGQDDEAESR